LPFGKRSCRKQPLPGGLWAATMRPEEDLEFRVLGPLEVVAEGRPLNLGGVKQREVKKTITKFPILGDIPLISLLFKHSKTETLDRDLVIVVSPSIVRQLARTFPKNLPGEEREGGR